MTPDEQIAKLDEAFLKSISIDAGTVPDQTTRANLHAYLVLSHAVMEEHIESLFESYFQRLLSHLDDEKIPRACLTLAYSVADRASATDKLSYHKRSVRHEIERLGAPILAKAIKSNNGLKQNNVESLAQAAGVSWNEFDDALSTHLANLQSLGVRRGDAGHLSPFSGKLTAIEEVIHPSHVREWVNNGLNALVAIEQFLDGTLKTATPASETTSANSAV